MVDIGDMSIFNDSINGLAVSDMKVGTQYFVFYPYQSGIISFFTLLFRAFGQGTSRHPDSEYRIECRIDYNAVTCRVHRY